MDGKIYRKPWVPTINGWVYLQETCRKPWVPTVNGRIFAPKVLLSTISGIDGRD